MFQSCYFNLNNLQYWLDILHLFIAYGLYGHWGQNSCQGKQYESYLDVVHNPEHCLYKVSHFWDKFLIDVDTLGNIWDMFASWTFSFLEDITLISRKCERPLNWLLNFDSWKGYFGLECPLLSNNVSKESCGVLIIVSCAKQYFCWKEN